MTCLKEIDDLVSKYVMRLDSVTDSQSPPVDGDFEMKGVPPYSSSISAAYEVVKKLCDEYEVTFKVRRDRSPEYIAEFRWWAKDADYLVTGVGKADSMPLAICLAALRALEIECQPPDF